MAEIVSNGPSVFLCHATEDKPAVRELYRQLSDRGVTPWLDDEDLLPGQHWEDEIRRAIRTTKVVIVCLSRKSISKEGFVHKEIAYALDVASEKPEGTIYIIPARLEPCDVPIRLKKWHRVDIFESRGFEKLLRALGVEPLGDSTPDALNPENCVVISDGSEYSLQLAAIAQTSGFGIQLLSGVFLESAHEALEEQYRDVGLILLVRGEHFQSRGTLGFYNRIRGFVARGGFFFATPWVSWETHSSRILTEVLPFEHSNGDFTEDNVLSFQDPLSARSVEFSASFEHLTPARNNAKTLLTSTTGIPLLGVREYGRGCCVYLNACQHSCGSLMDSPLRRNPELTELLRQTLAAMRFEMIARRRVTQREGKPFVPEWVR